MRPSTSFRSAFVGSVCLSLFCVSSFWVNSAFAHIDLTDPPMRGGDQKANPCEGVARGEPTEYEAGSTITVSWTETIDHPGYFRISFDPDGDSFDNDGDGIGDFPESPNAPDSGNGSDQLVLLEVQDEGGSEFSAEVTLPDVECDNCTLQLIQNMTERTPSAMMPTAHLYFRCADIVLTRSGAGTGGMGGAGSGGGPGIAGTGGILVPSGGSGGDAPDVVEPQPTPDPPEGGTAGTPSNEPPGETPVTPEPVTPGMPTTIPPATPQPEAPGGTGAPAPTSMPTVSPSTSATSPALDGQMTNSGDDGGCAVTSRRPARPLGAILLGLSLIALRRRRR